MPCFTCGSCPISAASPAPFSNTASVVGRYNCSALCFGDLSAVSEPVVIEVMDVSLTKTVSATCAAPGATVRYTITLRNDSSLPIANVLITDPEIEDLLEVGAIFYNGLPVTGSLSEGILIPGVGAGACAALTFDAAVPDETTGVITNVAAAAFDFTTALCGTVRETVTSNEAVLNVISPALTITKTADRCTVTPEEPTVTFTLTVTNTGTCPVENVVVTDVLPAGLTYVAGSTSVNGDDPTDLNPAAGISLGTLAVDAAATIEFQATAAF